MSILDNLDRPLAVFDIEATGLNRKLDRLIDLCVVVIQPGGARTEHNFRVHPGRAIPPESTALHGISDADVRGLPPFSGVIEDVDRVFAGADLCGYSLHRFDIPLLEEEFRRCRRTFDWSTRRVLDAQKIFFKREPRDLSAALRFYAGEEHTNAHGAASDVMATIKVIEGQFEKYGDLPVDMESLDEYCNPRDPSWADRKGLLKKDAAGEVLINFGRKQGRYLKELAKNSPDFLKWIARTDFPRDVQDIVKSHMQK